MQPDEEASLQPSLALQTQKREGDTGCEPLMQRQRGAWSQLPAAPVAVEICYGQAEHMETSLKWLIKEHLHH